MSDEPIDITTRFYPITPPRWSRYEWPAWMFHHDRGIGYFRLYGWGVQWRDTRSHPPTYGPRAQWTKVGIGPYLFRLLRP